MPLPSFDSCICSYPYEPCYLHQQQPLPLHYIPDYTNPYDHSQFFQPNMAFTPPPDESDIATEQEFDFETEQALSNTWNPEITGPLIDIRQSTANIVIEYQTGHPVHRVKVAKLACDYPSMRKIRGDGNCGYRAIFFGYLEVLLKLQSVEKIHAEAQRIRALDDLVKSYLGPPDDHNDDQNHDHDKDKDNSDLFDMIQDFLDPAFELIKDMPVWLTATNRSQRLIAAFEEAGGSTDSYYIQHLRYLASAWIRSKADDYVNFLEGRTVDEYCKSQIEAVNCDIDSVALQALSQVLIEPAGFRLQVLYLDLSEGDAVTVHNYNLAPVPDNQVINLLYRPGHYDLVYEEPERLVPMVHFVGLADDYGIPDPAQFDFLFGLDVEIPQLLTPCLTISNFHYDMGFGQPSMVTPSSPENEFQQWITPSKTPTNAADGLMWNERTKRWSRYNGLSVTREEVLQHVRERGPEDGNDVYNPANVWNPCFQPEIVRLDKQGNILPSEMERRALKKKEKARAKALARKRSR